MSILKYENKNFTNDIVYHLEQLECDLLRIQIDNNRNFILSKSIDTILIRINKIKMLIQFEPRFDLKVIYNELIKIIRKDNQLSGCHIILDWKEVSTPNRGILKFSINKPKTEKDELR